MSKASGEEKRAKEEEGQPVPMKSGTTPASFFEATSVFYPTAFGGRIFEKRDGCR